MKETQRRMGQSSSPFDVLSSKTKIPSKDSPQQKCKRPLPSSTGASLFNAFHSENQAYLAARTRARTTSLGQPSTERLEREIQGLHQLASALAPIPPLSDSLTTIHEDAEERKELFERTKDLMAVLEQAIEQKIINPSGKHGRSVSAILANLMRIYSASHHREEEQSAFEECLYALSFLDYCNLDRQETHYQYSILSAVNEQRWQDASDLFLQQIDREISGFCPVKVSVSSPVGLYAIAKAAQDKGSSGVETVLEAVTSLSLISPTEQDQYVLAAGTALGQAGDWEGLLSYLENSINASSMGQSLVAAAMHACILCNQNDAALQVFQTLLDGHLAISSEFHWGGGEHQISPLCRDLAMRACADTIEEGYSTQATHLLNQALKGELAISAEALEGVLGACERDKNWKDAVDVLFRCMNSECELWVVPGPMLLIPTIGELNQKEQLKGGATIANRGKLVASAMRTCNARRQFGAALLCFILADTAPPGSLLFTKKQGSSIRIDSETCGPIEETLLPMLAAVENPTELLVAVTVSLCGVSCFEEARSLIDGTKSRMEGTADFADADSIHQYAQLHTDAPGAVRAWNSAHQHIHRLSTALRAINIKGEILDQNQLQVLSSAYATALCSCAQAKQAVAGILLGQRMQSELFRLAASSEDSQTIFGRPTEGFSDYGVAIDDNLLAEKVKALEITKQADVASSLFVAAVDVEKEAILRWPQTCNAAVNLLTNNGQETQAESLMQNIINSTDNIESFATASKILADAERWSDVADLYHMALEKGCLSTKLGILAMKAIVEMNMPGRLRVLRSTTHDCARFVGLSTVDWLDANYWKIKAALGFKHARLLMWWNDPNTSHSDELQYALEIFEKRRCDGLQAKNVTLRLIVAHARYFREGDFPPEKKEIVRVPRDQQGWISLLERVFQEASNLEDDDHFRDDYATALRNLGCNVECVAFVTESMQRGVAVRRSGLNEALIAADEAGIYDDTGVIKLALYA